MNAYKLAELYSEWKPEDFRRLDACFQIGTPEECWLWEGRTNGRKASDYPVFAVKERVYAAPQVVYDRVLGLPKSRRFLRLRRTCGGSPLCVNPHHREVTHVNHPKRKQGRKKKRRGSNKKNTCHRGHGISTKASRLKDGSCKLCKRIQNQRYREKQIAEGKMVSQRNHGDRWAERASELLEKY